MTTLKQKFQLNLKFPIRLTMVEYHSKDCLIRARRCLKRNDIRTAKVMVKLASEGITDLEYYFKQTSLQEQKIEFTKIKNDIRDLQCCQRAMESFP